VASKRVVVNKKASIKGLWALYFFFMVCLF
jgi:hypothetical protein